MFQALGEQEIEPFSTDNYMFVYQRFWKLGAYHDTFRLSAFWNKDNFIDFQIED